MRRVGVCLSGCGFLDGAEIHESVAVLTALDRAGLQAVCCAPNIAQAAVVNHWTRRPAQAGGPRNVLEESARIARGDIRDLAEVRPEQLEALVFPGGFGAAKNLCDFADRGSDCKVHPAVERLVGGMLDAGKPVAAICIAPAMLARILGKRGIRARLTIGNDPQTAAAIERMGVTHVQCTATDCVVDEEHRILSTPAYMLAKGPAEVFQGVGRLVEALARMIG